MLIQLGFVASAWHDITNVYDVNNNINSSVQVSHSFQPTDLGVSYKKRPKYSYSLSPGNSAEKQSNFLFRPPRTPLPIKRENIRRGETVERLRKV